MVWNEKPLYEKYKNMDKPISEFQRYVPANNGDSPSHIFSWHIREEKKRQQGLENEIDINLIKAALGGVKNKWFNLVNKYPKSFEQENKKFNWEEIKKLMGN
jgi:hypothetical protein